MSDKSIEAEKVEEKMFKDKFYELATKAGIILASLPESDHEDFWSTLRDCATEAAEMTLRLSLHFVDTEGHA